MEDNQEGKAMNTFKNDICEALELDYGKNIQEASTVELYDAVFQKRL